MAEKILGMGKKERMALKNEHFPYKKPAIKTFKKRETEQGGRTCPIA